MGSCKETSSSMAVERARGKSISSSSSRFSYHVFLSFRGKDTRKKFADHLYSALVEAGLDTFRDDDEIERGEGIEHGIWSAMRESRVGVVVLSKDYASSTWCLDELLMLLVRRRTAGLILIPVFYEVDPSQVRAQLGNYGEAFTNHKARFENEMNLVEAWRAALREVSAIGGLVFQDGYEAQFVKDVVEKVCKAALYPPLYVCHNLVGIETRTRDINSWLQDLSNCIGIAMIFGIGGVGKTTVAKTVYNQNFNNFERISFISSVREVAAQSGGLLRLQRQLLLDICKGKTAKPRSVDEGILKIRDAICRKRVLIVLDDVQHAEELQAFIGMEGPPKSGSKLIVTTRNEGLLKAHIPCLKIKVEPLDNVASLKLFSWHAFGKDHPSNDCIKLCRIAIRHCGGLPLALEVLGSCLSRLSIHQWESALREPVEIDDGKIQKVLKISFDSLQDDRDKNLLLDVACFFVGMDKDYVEKVLEGWDSYRVLGLQRLTERCLVATDENNKLVMHQLIRDTARELVGQESENPGERTRVWRHKDAINVLRRNLGTKKVRSFVLDCKQTNARSTEKMELRIEAMSEMRNLKLLNLNNAVLKGDCKEFPTSLVWLSWHGFPLNPIPNEFDFEYLVVLDMSGSKLQVFGDRFQCLASLKILNLSHSHFLVSIPDFNVVPSLERLILENCSSLAEIDESIGILNKLICLNLKDCRSLEMLPEEIGRLESLQKLVLSGCSGLSRGRRVQPNSTNSAITNMKRPSFQPADKRPRTSWSLFSFLPRFLVHLSLTNCNLSDDAIPEDLSQLQILQELDLGNNPIRTLPESIQRLTSLDSLSLYQCERLQYLPELPDSLNYVNVSGCTSLERIRGLKSFARAKCLILYGCQNLVKIGGIFELNTLKNVNQEMISRLRLFDLTSFEGSEVNVVSYISGNKRKTPFQVLSECGILSLYLLGSDLPSWYNYRNEKRSALSFNVPCNQCHPVIGINLCIAYAAVRSADGKRVANFDGSALPFVTVENETKGLIWTYFPTCYEIEDVESSKLWLSHWSLRDGFAGNDHVYVRVGAQCGIEVKKIGVFLVYEAEEGSQSISAAAMTDFGGTVMNCEGPPFVVGNHFRYCPLLRFSLRPKAKLIS